MELLKWVFMVFVVMPLFVAGVAFGLWGIATADWQLLVMGAGSFGVSMFVMGRMGAFD